MNKRIAVSLVSLLLAGCGGGGGGSTPAAVPVATKTAQMQSGTIGLTFGTQAGTSSKSRTPLFVSPNATSAVVDVNNGPTTTFDVSASSPYCQTVITLGVRTCALPFSVPVGLDSIGVALQMTVAGKPLTLGQGSNSVTVVLGTPFTLPVGINPVVTGAGTVPFTTMSGSLTYRTSATMVQSVSLADPSGAVITGFGNVPNFLTPLTVSSSDPNVVVTPAQLTTPGQTISIAYNGSAAVSSSVTIAVKSSTATVASETLAFPGLIATRCDLGAPNTVQPEQIAVGPDHDIWWTERTTNLIGRINPAVGCSSLQHFSTGLGSVIGIAAGGDGNMWFSNGGTQIQRISTGTTPALVGSPIIAGTGGSQIGRLIADQSGNIWYEDSGSTTSRFGYVDKMTLTPTNFAMTTTHPLLEGTGLTLASDGSIYFLIPVFSGGTSKLGRVTTLANGTPGLYTETSIANTSSSVFPFDLATGSDGKEWVSVFGSVAANQFYASFQPGGSSLTEYPNIIDPQSFANLVTMTAGPDGNLWIAEGGGAVRIVPSDPTHPTTEFFTDNAQTTMVSCIAGPDSNLWCTATGSGPNPGFTATNDSIVYWTPR
jgi:streptogramin lyase